MDLVVSNNFWFGSLLCFYNICSEHMIVSFFFSLTFCYINISHSLALRSISVVFVNIRNDFLLDILS